MGARCTTRLEIIALLEEHGALHVSSIAEILDRKILSIHSCIRDMRKLKLIYISGWKRSFGTKGRWGAIYSIGQEPDVPPPRVNSVKQANKRYREKYRTVINLRQQKRRGKLVHPWLLTLGAT